MTRKNSHLKKKKETIRSFERKHAIQRGHERYGLNVNHQDIVLMVTSHHSIFISRIDRTDTVQLVKLGGKWIPIIWDGYCHRVKTILPWDDPKVSYLKEKYHVDCK